MRRLLFALALLAAPPAMAQPGTLDPSFAMDGVYALENRQTGASEVLIRPDGRILLVGIVENETAVVSLLPDGSLDPSFGTNGIGRFRGASTYSVGGAALFSDGSVVIAGALIVDEVFQASALLKMNAGGTPEASFGTNGVATFTPEQGFDQTILVAARELANGGIASGGSYSLQQDGTAGVLMAHFTASGALDTSYDDDGVLSSPSDAGFTAISGDFDASGALYINGGTVIPDAFFELDAALVRLTPEGTLDADFGEEGVFSFETGVSFSLVTASSIDPEGRIVAVGIGADLFAGTSEAFVLRLLPDGSFDDSFADGGLFRTLAGAPIAQATSVALQPDGRVIFAGTAGTDALPQFFAARLDASGAPDASFGDAGFTRLSFGPAISTDLALQQDGNILLAGVGGNGSDDPTGVFAARLLSGGSILAGERTAEAGPLALSLAGPNPFARGTALALEATQPLAARVAAFDALGRQVALLHDGPLAPGRTVVELDARGLAPGTYWIRASAGRASVTRAVVRR